MRELGAGMRWPCHERGCRCERVAARGLLLVLGRGIREVLGGRAEGSECAVDLAASACPCAARPRRGNRCRHDRPAAAQGAPQALVVGVDRAVGMLRRGPNALPRAAADAVALPFAGEMFDVVVMACGSAPSTSDPRCGRTGRQRRGSSNVRDPGGHWARLATVTDVRERADILDRIRIRISHLHAAAAASGLPRYERRHRRDRCQTMTHRCPHGRRYRRLAPLRVAGR